MCDISKDRSRTTAQLCTHSATALLCNECTISSASLNRRAVKRLPYNGPAIIMRLGEATSPSWRRVEASLVSLNVHRSRRPYNQCLDARRRLIPISRGPWLRQDVSDDIHPLPDTCQPRWKLVQHQLEVDRHVDVGALWIQVAEHQRGRGHRVGCDTTGHERDVCRPQSSCICLQRQTSRCTLNVPC